MQDYKKLYVWQESHKFVLDIYKITSGFPNSEIYGITSQIRRSSISIPANIAEGCGKNTSNDFANFLQISLGSANETEYLLLLVKELKYINDDVHIKLENKINGLKGMLINLIKQIRKKQELKTLNK